jgi:hypothetical protein
MYDVGVLIIYLFDCINIYFVEEQLDINSTMYCVFFNICYAFQVAGIGMMLIISVLRYRATVHPLKPDVSRRKLKVVCGLVYLVGFIAGYATRLLLCFMQWNDAAIVYAKVYNKLNFRTKMVISLLNLSIVILKNLVFNKVRNL